MTRNPIVDKNILTEKIIIASPYHKEVHEQHHELLCDVARLDRFEIEKHRNAVKGQRQLDF